MRKISVCELIKKLQEFDESMPVVFVDDSYDCNDDDDEIKNYDTVLGSQIIAYKGIIVDSDKLFPSDDLSEETIKSNEEVLAISISDCYITDNNY